MGIIWTHTDEDRDRAEIECRQDREGDSEYSLRIFSNNGDLAIVHLDRSALAGLRDAINKEPMADEPHLIQFRADGFTIQHPLRCRPNLFACPVNRVAHTDLAEPPALGVFAVELNDAGDQLVVGERQDGEPS